jgi:hypothetical protein
MAKCFRVVGQGVPVRMSDDDAHQVVVRDGDGEYCSKRFWRTWYAPNPDFPDKPVRDALRAKLVGNKITPTPSLSRQLQYARAR